MVVRFAINILLCAYAVMPRRVVIFGTAASGKSTLARRFSELLTADVLELDHIRWNDDRTELLTAEKCREQIESFIGYRDSWVVEGTHTSLLANVVQNATEIHFLNPPFEVCRERAMSRPWDPKKSKSLKEQREMVQKYEAWFKSYPERNDETSLLAHRELFYSFTGFKLEHTDGEVKI